MAFSSCFCSLVMLFVIIAPYLYVDADPTDGFTPVNLTEDNFDIQKPYNMPLNSRYSYKDGVRKLWVFSDDMPFSPGSGTKPRTEIRIKGLDYSSGVWQFQGYTLVPQGTSAVSIVQIHGITEATTCLQLRIYNGALDFFNYNTLATNIYNKWMRLNVIHDADERNIIVYMDGEKKFEAKDHGPGTFYFKCGVYGQDGMSHKMESQWRNIKIYKK